MDNLEFMNKFNPKDYCIKNFKYWLICIREKQNTLGSAVIILKRNVSSIGEINLLESEEFPEVIKWYEKTCKEKFGALKFNYIAMMMKDNFVHYHAFPRYNKTIEMFGNTWEDVAWPTGIDFFKGKKISKEKLLQIKSYFIGD